MVYLNLGNIIHKITKLDYIGYIISQCIRRTEMPVSMTVTNFVYETPNKHEPLTAGCTEKRTPPAPTGHVA